MLSSKRGGIFKKYIQRGKRSSHDNIVMFPMIATKVLNPIVYTSNTIDIEFGHNCIHSLDLLTHRIKQVSFQATNHGERDARKSRASSHVEHMYR